ncbi:MAG: DsrE family protein [Gammaproteobacteria bacterium]|jgi:intracellular sulfur oxidation DsrE/DsrF family protein
MTKHAFKWLIPVMALTAFLGLSTAATAGSNEAVFPVIKGYGGVHPLPDAAVQPEKDKVYKAVFDIASDAKHGDVNSALFHVARAVNVFASAGIPTSHLKFVAVIHGAATHEVMDNEHYQKKFGMDNPNLDLIAKLKAAGVSVQVCGQALAGEGIEHAWVDKNVTITLSALSDNVIYGNMGYAYIRM